MLKEYIPSPRSLDPGIRRAMSRHQIESLSKRRIPERSLTVAEGGRKGNASMRSEAICASRVS